MIRTLAALALVSPTGCTTHLVPMTDTKPVPQEGIISTRATKPTADAQKITIVRNAGAMFGAAVRAQISVDGERVAALATSEALSMYLPPGEHVLMGAFTKLGNYNSAVSVTIPTRITVYRIDATDGNLKLQPSVE